MQRAAQSPTAAAEVRRKLLAFRHQYLRTETTLDFFADAINGRTNPQVAALLRACDTLAHRSMSQLLDQIGKTTPVALTYPDKGVGASILKAGLRLWDGGEVSPVAAIKIVRHNLLRPTALIHEAGHQAAHIAGWNEELAATLSEGISGRSSELADVWASWSTEIAADAFGFAHTGFASVAALHDVLAGDVSMVFRFTPGDPHPVSYIRVLLGVETCRYFYGDGPWDGLALAWRALHPLTDAPSDTRSLLEDSLPILKTVVRLTLDTPMRCFNGRPLRALIQPERVSPAALDELDEAHRPGLVYLSSLAVDRAAADSCADGAPACQQAPRPQRHPAIARAGHAAAGRRATGGLKRQPMVQTTSYEEMTMADTKKDAASDRYCDQRVPAGYGHQAGCRFARLHSE